MTKKYAHWISIAKLPMYDWQMMKKYKSIKHSLNGILSNRNKLKVGGQFVLCSIDLNVISILSLHLHESIWNDLNYSPCFRYLQWLLFLFCFENDEIQNINKIIK